MEPGEVLDLSLWCDRRGAARFCEVLLAERFVKAGLNVSQVGAEVRPRVELDWGSSTGSALQGPCPAPCIC